MGVASEGATAEPASARERLAGDWRGWRGRWRAASAKGAVRHLGLPVVLAAAAVMNLHRLSQNGYANIFYSAGVKAMLRSLHNFVFVSFDPGGLVSVDKPPLGLWVQVASAKIFGFSPLSLLVPGALESILAVGVLYVLLARRFGLLAALAGALALALFPSFVAVSRDNGVDPLLLLLLVLACGAGLRASETASLRWLLASAALVGLAFNTKTLAAYLVVPGIAVAYLVCAPAPLTRRLAGLLAAGVVMLAISFAWIAFVELTPASQRPYVGSSTNNTELGLTFEYNGFGRVEGQLGGPGTEKVRPGAFVPTSQILFPTPPRRRPPGSAGAPARGPAPPGPSRVRTSAHRGPHVLSPLLPDGRERNPIPFGGPPGALRLFGKGLGDQGGWLVPFALFGLLALAALIALDRDGDGAGAGAGAGAAAEEPAPPRPLREDPRLVALFVLGGWFAVEAVVLSYSKGIVHPYYLSALGPGVGAMVGAGTAALVALARLARRWPRVAGIVLAAMALASTLAAQIVLIHRVHYMVWFVAPVAAACAVGLVALIAARRLAPIALALALAALLATPAAYASTTWLAPVEGTFPAAGPKRTPGTGGYGVDGLDLRIDRALIGYLSSHRPGSRWAVLTVASDEAAPLILMGLDAGAIAGYSGTDQVLDGAGLARLVRSGQARYVLLGGDYSQRGGNGATKAVLRSCAQVRSGAWHSPVPFPNGLVLLDCAGREDALASAGH